MILSPDIQVKELSNTAAGELVRFELRGASALAVVMRQTENGTVCAFLETNDEARAPFFMIMSTEDLMCMSHGKDWLLDLTFDANSFPGNDRYSTQHGIIHVGENKAAINLNHPPDDIRINAMAVDLKTFKTVDVNRRTYVPVASWRIWQTAAARGETNSDPLFVFKCPSQTA